MPIILADGTLKENLEGKHIDVVSEKYEFCDIDMENCFDGLETQKVYKEMFTVAAIMYWY